MLDPKQTDKYSEDELELLKKVFGNDSPALLALRNLFYQFELSKEEKDLLKFSEETLNLLKRIWFPKNSPNTPLNWILNMYQGLKEIRTFSPEGADIHIRANDILIEYVSQQLNELEGGHKGDLVLEELPKDLGGKHSVDRFVEMLAYHNICAYIEGRIAEIRTRANPAPEPTPEELAKKELQNSTK